jgi:hypothetical protein
MPKIEINYSNTTFYKIVCKDHNIIDKYIGYTTNFVQRKYLHKQHCTNDKSVNYDLLVYNKIRQHGGWDNWNMEIITNIQCKNHDEVIEKEQEYITLFNATLNTNTNISGTFSCSNCEKVYESNSGLWKHVKKCSIIKNTPNIIQNDIDGKIFKDVKNCSVTAVIKNKPIITPDGTFVCSNCEKVYESNSGLWKHVKKCSIITNKSTINSDGKIACANCEKVYESKSGLLKHKKKCSPSKKTNEIIDEIIFNTNENNSENTNKLIMSLMKQNKEFKELMIEQNNKILEQHQQLLVATKENKHIINNTTNNNFNLNVFLNETCKDALNMMEFVKSMNLQLVDLEETGKLGYSGGMSRIFINGLKGLDINKRPIHCSDLKREVLYIKEDNVWEKDNDERTKIKKAIREIEHKNIKQIPLFVKEHPNCIIGSNRENTPYLKMVMQSTGGVQSEEENNINKIITNIAKEVVINK